MTIIRFFGFFGLILSCIVSLFGFFDTKYYKKIEIIKFFSISATFLVLVFAFIVGDFSISSVFNNSSVLQPLIYKISAVWSHHEGSMLFWVLIMQIYAIVFLKFSKFDENIIKFALKINNFTIFALLIYIVTISNPFSLTDGEFINGLGMNPVLQDAFVAIHPPKLYFGYVGTGILFAISLALVAKTNLEKKEFFVAFHPWITFAWMMLTGGIILGGNWAYRELGWGGFWSWDPVENISIIPWIIMTIMFHANLVAQKQPIFRKTVILSGSISFLASMFGTALVRSGKLISLHSFSQDNTRWIGMLVIVAMLIAITVLIFYKSKYLRLISDVELPSSGLEIIKLSNILLIIIAIFITIGTITPFFIKNSTIDAKFFNMVCFAPAFLCLILSGIAPIFKTKFDAKKIATSIAIFIFLVVAFFYRYNFNFSIGLLFIFGAFFTVAILFSSVLLAKNFKVFAIMLWAHGGFALIVIGLILPVSIGFEKDIILTKKPVNIGKYEVYLQKINYDYGKNYLIRKAEIIVKNIGVITPETRFYPIENTFSSETSTLKDGIDDIYIAINGADTADKSDIKLHLHVAYRPGIQLLWIGTFISLIGVFVHFIKNILY